MWSIRAIFHLSLGCLASWRSERIKVAVSALLLPFFRIVNLYLRILITIHVPCQVVIIKISRKQLWGSGSASENKKKSFFNAKCWKKRAEKRREAKGFKFRCTTSYFSRKRALVQSKERKHLIKLSKVRSEDRTTSICRMDGDGEWVRWAAGHALDSSSGVRSLDSSLRSLKISARNFIELQTVLESSDSFSFSQPRQNFPTMPTTSSTKTQRAPQKLRRFSTVSLSTSLFVFDLSLAVLLPFFAQSASLLLSPIVYFMNGS